MYSETYSVLELVSNTSLGGLLTGGTGLSYNNLETKPNTFLNRAHLCLLFNFFVFFYKMLLRTVMLIIQPLESRNLRNHATLEITQSLKSRNLFC